MLHIVVWYGRALYKIEKKNDLTEKKMFWSEQARFRAIGVCNELLWGILHYNSQWKAKGRITTYFITEIN